jgi:hypothetical protein
MLEGKSYTTRNEPELPAATFPSETSLPVVSSPLMVPPAVGAVHVSYVSRLGPHPAR